MKSIVPLSEAPRELVEQYLTESTRYFRTHGPAAIGWKYYDAAFNRGRDRGYVWLRDGRVRGFIGLVPATIARGDETRAFAWTCDWGLADPTASPGMGVRLLRQVLAGPGSVATCGGNHNTRSLVPRIAARTVEDAGQYFWRPLTTGALLHLAADRAPALGRVARSPLGKLPIPWPLRRGRARAIDGIDPALDALIDRLGGRSGAAAGTSDPARWFVRYDVAHLEWALARCPGLRCGTVRVDGDRGPVAAAVWWYPESSPVRHVRFALWREPGADDAARDVLGALVACARRAGGALISTVAEASDPALTSLFTRRTMLRRRAPLPLYLLSPGVDSLGGLNYLAADLAQRFRGTAG